MKIEIKHWNCEHESEAIKAFLEWQCQPPLSIQKRVEVLEYTKGRPACLILIVNKAEAYETCLTGFKELLKYWEDKGLWILC